MKNVSLIVAAAFFAGNALASPPPTPANLIREFACEGTYSDPKAPNQQNALLDFTAKLSDYSLTQQADPSYTEYVGAAELTGAFVPPSAKVSWVETGSDDVEVERDDDPQSRNGWGGKAFYTSVLKGERDNPQEIFLFVTVATKEQQGLAIREYEIAGFKMSYSEGANEDTTQELLAHGKMICKQI